MPDKVNTRTKRLRILLPLLILAAAAALWVLFFENHSFAAAGREKTSMKTILLYGNDNPEDLKILRIRLDYFSGKGKYSLTEQNGCLLLRLPVPQNMNDDHLCECLEYFLTEPGPADIVCNYPDADFSFPFADFTLAKIDPASCVGTNTKNTEPEEIIREDADYNVPVLNMDESDARIFTLKLTKNVSAPVREKLDQGIPVYLIDNTVYREYDTNRLSSLGYRLAADPEDPCSFSITYGQTSILYGNEKLFAYNLQHESLSRPYNYYLQDEIEWTDPGSSNFSGVFQRSDEDLGDSWFFFEIQAYDLPSLDEQEAIDRFLARRLDYLESPYAIGHTSEGAICVKTSSDRINSNVLDLLITKDQYIILYAPSAEYSLFPEHANIQYSPDTGTIEVSLSEENMRELRENVSGFTQAQKTDIYLITESGPVARAELTLSADDDTLLFKDTIFLQENNGERDYTWFINLMQDSLESSGLDITGLNLNYYYRHTPGQDTYNDPAVFPLKKAELISVKDIEEKIQVILPQAEAELSDNLNTLIIKMNLKTDKTLPDRIFELAPPILQASSLENSFYWNLCLDLCEYTGNERAWLFFTRSPYGSDHDESGVYIQFSGYLYNGRMDQYADRILQLQEKDSFFKNLTLDPEYDRWILRDFD